MHVVVVDGELDLGTAPQLEAALEEAARASGPVLVDLCHTTFMGSSGLSALLGACRRVRDQGRRFGVACSPGERSPTSSRSTATADVLRPFPDRPAALAVLRA